MAPPGGDPYSDLRGLFEARRRAYLTMLTSSQSEFEADPLTFGTAQRRGFLRSPRSPAPAPKPTASFADQDAAGDAAGKYLALWTDDARLRAGDYEPWDVEDVRLAIARLTMHKDPQQFLDHTWMDAEPPPADSTYGLAFDHLFLLARQLGVIGRPTVRQKVRGVLASAGDSQVGRPDYNPVRTFDPDVIESVIELLDRGGKPDAAADTAKAVALLAGVRVEDSEQAITELEVRALIADLGRLIPGKIIDKLIDELAERAHPGPYVLPPDPNAPPPSSWEPPPPSYQEPPDGRDRPPSTEWEKPPSTYDNPNAKPVPIPPRPPSELLRPSWDAIRFLAALGTICRPIWTVRRALKGLQAWSKAVTGGDYLEKIAFDPRVDVLSDLFGRDGVPPEFVYPSYSRSGIYWWRAVVRSHVIEHCFALKDTADFHSTDLIRFLMLSADGDPRIDAPVREAARLALRYFKYWIDQPAATKFDGGSRDEMTFWSENHQILFAQSELFAALLLPDQTFPRAGLGANGSVQTGAEHLAGGLLRAERWLDHRLRFGMAEWNAPGYYNEDLPPLLNLAEFCPAPRPALPREQQEALARIGVKAAMVVDNIYFDLARFTCRGSFGVTAGRAYWEAKAYGWEQSVGDTIELLFGTRGDFKGVEPSAIALATCTTYQVPDALLGIGLDRAHLDRDQHFIDRSRVSISFDEAAENGVGFDTDEDMFFWWSLGAFFTPKTLEGTKRAVENHPHLRDTAPFKLLYALSDKWGIRFLVDMAGSIVDSIKVGTWAAIPFPANVVMMFISGDNIVDDFVDLVKSLWDAVKTIVHAVEKFIAGIFGFGSDDQPKIPDTTLQKILEALLITFNQGSVLSRANLVTFSDGDTMLSSTQNRLVGTPSAQTNPVEASLGLEACVWTTARFMNTDLGSFVAGAGQFLEDFGLVRLDNALVDVIAPIALTEIDDPFTHDGPNYWSGSLALPMVVQHERAAIAIYDISVDLRKFSGAATHAWFPTAMFDHTDKQDADGGTWFFGRKDTYTSDGSARTGSGYVALFSALKADWTNNDGPNPWNGKEIQAKGGSNIWIYVVGNEHDFGSFETFRREVLAAYLNISGVGTPNGLECSFDIPRTPSPPGRTARLEAFYGDRQGRFAGEDRQLDEFPRFENRYVQQISATRRPGSGGLGPQVQTLTSSASVGFGSRAYTVVHPVTGMSLDHDLDTPRRSFTQQPPPEAAKPKEQRLVDGSTTAIRPIDPRRHLHGNGQPKHPKALPRKAIRWPRTP